MIDYFNQSNRNKPLFLIDAAPISGRQFQPVQEILMGIIGSTIKPFKATAFKAGEDFFEVTNEDLQGKWAIFFLSLIHI